jgi:hypothetical protein
VSVPAQQRVAVRVAPEAREDGKKSTGQVTTIKSTSLAPKSNWRMRASSLRFQLFGLEFAGDDAQASNTGRDGAIFSSSTTLPCSAGSSRSARL